MSSKNTHWIPSDLAQFGTYLVFDDAGKQASTFVLFCHPLPITFVIFNSSHMQSATREVHRLFPTPSLV